MNEFGIRSPAPRASTSIPMKTPYDPAIGSVGGMPATDPLDTLALRVRRHRVTCGARCGRRLTPASPALGRCALISHRKGCRYSAAILGEPPLERIWAGAAATDPQAVW